MTPVHLKQCLRPHDLLWCDSVVFSEEAPAPKWAHDGLQAGVPVVVRRAARGPDALIPVGLRGHGRDQRAAAFVPVHDVSRVATPESLVASIAEIDPDAPLRSLQWLRQLAPAVSALGLHWGPTGGVGYALASGRPVLHSHSDLDLVVRMPFPPTASQCEALAWIVRDPLCRMDIQVDTGHGGFALLDWLRSPHQTLLKTDRGPVLVADPWDGLAEAI